MSYTTAEILLIAKKCQFLVSNDIEKKGLSGGGIDLQLAKKIKNIRESIEYIYNLDSSDSTLFGTGNYLLALCMPYVFKAVSISGGGGSIAPITPITPIKSPIRITSDDFANATEWDGVNSDGIEIQPSYTLQVFANFIARYLEEGVEWERTLTGINILLPGFDAQTMDYEFYIDISA